MNSGDSQQDENDRSAKKSRGCVDTNENTSDGMDAQSQALHSSRIGSSKKRSGKYKSLFVSCACYACICYSHHDTASSTWFDAYICIETLPLMLQKIHQIKIVMKTMRVNFILMISLSLRKEYYYCIMKSYLKFPAYINEAIFLCDVIYPNSGGSQQDENDQSPKKSRVSVEANDMDTHSQARRSSGSGLGKRRSGNYKSREMNNEH